MAISITVDNDRTTTPPNPPFDPLLLDETAGVQTPATADDGNEINVTLAAGLLGGFTTAFNTFLNSASLALTTAQKEYARDHDGASSASNFVLVTTSAGETINDLFFANASGGALVGVPVVGMTTLDDQSVYLWSNGNFGSSGDFCVATTSNVAGSGEVVAAFYLNEAADHKSAQVQMVVFEPLEHNNDGLDPDDALNFTDALRIGASGSLSFDFDQLASQSSLWVAVGNSSEAVLISGVNPDVDNTTGKKTNASDVIHTSQGGQGATIGVNNQLFDNVGETGVFTLVTGLQGLVGADAGVLSDYVIDDPTSGGVEQGIAYDGYIPNILGAGIFISQDQGKPGATKSLDINVFKTNNAGEEEGFGYVYSNGTTKTGDALTDDIGVNVTTVSVRDNNGALIGTWVLGADPDGAGPLRANGATVAGVQVTITGNNIDVNNFGVQYTISWTTAEAFNRFNVVNEAGAWDIGRVDVNRTVPSLTPLGDKLFVEDDGPTAGSAVLKHVDEDAMTGVAGSDLSTGHVETPDDADGIAGEQDEVTFSQADLAAAVNAGTDAPAVFSLNASLVDGTAVTTTGGANVLSKGDQVFYRTVSGVIQGVTDAGTADERIIFTITRNDGGTPSDSSDDTFTFDLKDQLDHANASGELSLLTLNVSPAFSATDSDNDPANLGSLIRVEVENDTPRADGDTLSKEVHEDALTGGNTPDGDLETKVVTVTYTKADLNGLATTGADEDLTFSLNAAVIGTNVVTTGGANVTSGGVNVVWAAGAGGSLQGVISGTATTVFTLTPSGDDFVVTLVEQVDHSGAESDSELLALDLTSAFKAVDFDLDPLALNADSIVLNVENDLPIFNGQILSKTLDWVNNGFVTGSLFGKVGADDPASYIIDKYTDLAGYVETLSADGKTLTYSIGGTTYFTLALNDAANSGAGSYTFTVNQPPPQPTLELNFQDLDSGQNLFGTVAFNKANINNNGTPGDASDDFLPDGGLMTFPTNIDINDGEAGESNDGTMTNTSGTTNTSKGGGPVTIGNSNQAFDNAGEGAWFAYVDNPETEAVSGVGLNANLADDADNVRFDGMIEVTKASVEIVQASGAGTAKRPGPAMLVTAYDIDPGKVDSSAESRAFVLDPSATGDQANIIGVKIYDANKVLIEYRVNADAGTTNFGILQDIPGNTDDSAVVIQFNLDDNGGTPADPTDDIYSILVSNLQANYTIEWETEGVHDAAKVERAAGSYDIGGFNLLQGQDTADVDFEFSVAIRDKDNDLNNFNGTNDVYDDFKIKVDGTGGFDDPANVAPSAFLTSYDLI